VRPELVAEVKYLTWTDDNLLGRSFTRVCVRKPAAAEVRRPTAGTKPEVGADPNLVAVRAGCCRREIPERPAGSRISSGPLHGAAVNAVKSGRPRENFSIPLSFATFSGAAG
jgi:hypothetical protein